MTDKNEMFWRHVDRTGNDGCWLWKGTKFQHFGYGRINRKGKSLYAHRQAWELTFGPIGAGLHVLHQCDNPSCVNPKHLKLGTHAENMAEAKARGRYRSGEAHPLSKCNSEQVQEIRSSSDGPFELARRFGLSYQTIRRIRKGEARKNG